MAEELDQYPLHPIPDENILMNFLKFLAQVIKIPHFLDKVRSIRGLILMKIVFPCMLTTPRDT